MITLISLSVSGSLLVLALFALKPVMKAGCTRAFAYYIWLIVLIRLMLPVGASVNAMDALFSGIPATTVQEAADVSYNITDPDVSDIDYSTTGEAASVAPDVLEELTVQDGTVSDTQSTPAINSFFDLWAFIRSNLIWIWAAGAFISLMWFVIGYLRFCRQIRRTSTEASAGGLCRFPTYMRRAARKASV